MKQCQRLFVFLHHCIKTETLWNIVDKGQFLDTVLTKILSMWKTPGENYVIDLIETMLAYLSDLESEFKPLIKTHPLIPCPHLRPERLKQHETFYVSLPVKQKNKKTP